MSREVRVADMVVFLMRRPRTIRELQDLVGADKKVVTRWMKKLHRAGRVEPCGFDERTGPGARAIRWKWAD